MSQRCLCVAICRAYRLGQKQNVSVYRRVTVGTIEEMIYLRHLYKTHLTSATLTSASSGPNLFHAVMNEQHGELFGMKNLFTFIEDGILKAILKRNRTSAQRRAMVSDKEESSLLIQDPHLNVTMLNYDAPDISGTEVSAMTFENETTMAAGLFDLAPVSSSSLPSLASLIASSSYLCRHINTSDMVRHPTTSPHLVPNDSSGHDSDISSHMISAYSVGRQD